MPPSERADVVIIGGGIMGASTARFLAGRPDFDGRIVVVERDPTFRTSSTTLSAASIRLQFSTPLNIALSAFGLEVIRDLEGYLGVDGEVPDIGFVEGGYLFLATEAGLPILESNHAVQRALDVPVVLLTPAQLRARFPWLETSDLAGASLGTAGEGWFDAWALLGGFRRKARSLGVEELAGEVVGIDVAGDGARVDGVRLADGTAIEARWVVNAAGPHAGDVAALAGVDLPVRPRKRYVWHVAAPDTGIGLAPLTVDPTGLYFRSEGPNFITGYSPGEDEPDPDTYDLTVDRSRFEARVWPTLAARVPAFDELRLLDAWAGHYEVNTLDHNAIVGPHPRLANLLFANGFSGHGLQQGPAVGRALAEWICAGRWETIDCSAFGYGRIERGEPLREVNVV